MVEEIVLLKEIDDLLQLLAAENVRYVHWKSNWNVRRALCGEQDLDLLIHPADRERFQELLKRAGFLRAISHKDSWQKDIFHYLNVDLASLNLVHVHAHYSLTLGYDFHKNYTLPIIDWYLAGRYSVDGISVPILEKEYIIFLIRILLKNGLSEFLLRLPLRQIRMVADSVAGRDVIASERAELIHFQSRLSLSKLQDCLSELAQFSPSSKLYDFSSEFKYFESSLKVDSSLANLWRSSRALKIILRGCRETNGAISFFKSFVRINEARAQSLLKYFGLGRSKKLRCENGGRIIALVGGDGAGKSTNVSSLHNLLSTQLYCRRIHVGRPKRSLLGLCLTILARISRILQAVQLSAVFDAFSLALSRRAAFRRAEEIRRDGGVAILDRLPTKLILSMDSPRIPRLAAQQLAKLSRYEREIYEDIRGVDLLFVLKLDPNIALQRRPDDVQSLLLERSGEIWRADWSKSYMYTVDTGVVGVEAVRRSLVSKVWQSLGTKFVRCEIAGLSGAGKSTVVNGIVEDLSNVKISLPYRERPIVALRVCLTALLQIVRARVRPTANLVRNLAQLLYFIEAADSLNNRKSVRSHHYVLDQGPVFQLAMMIKEGIISPKDLAFKRAIAGINLFFSDGCIFLDTSDEDLRRRVLGRLGQSTRSSELDDNGFLEFCRQYREAFKVIAQNTARVNFISSHSKTNDVLKAASLVIFRS